MGHRTATARSLAGGGVSGDRRRAGAPGNKKEARIALIKRSRSLGLAVVLILRGAKGLEKVFVVDGEDELNRVLKQFSAIAVEVDEPEPESSLELPGQLREAVASFKELLERLSEELASLVGW